MHNSSTRRRHRFWSKSLRTLLHKTKSDTNTVQKALDFNELCEPLSHVVHSACVPLTSVLLQDRDYVYRKTLIGVTSSTPQSPTIPAGQGNLQSLRDGLHINGIPRELREARADEIDQMGGATIFRIGSLAKLLVALTYCVIIEKKVFDSLNWDTRILPWIADLYGQSASISKIGIDKETSVSDILLHRKSLPSMHRFLFLADGTFQIQDEDFISYLEAVVEDLRPVEDTTKTDYQYSNANYILMAILLAKQTGNNIETVMTEHLLSDLGMNRTYLNREESAEPIQSHPKNYALGQRTSGDLINHSTIPQQPCLDSTAYKVSVGMWSCADDLAKLFGAIIDGRFRPDGHITSDIVNAFLEYSLYENDKNSQKIGITMAGLVYHLTATSWGHESLNHVIRQQNRSEETSDSNADSSKQLGKLSLYYKGGTCDGFTSTVYLHVMTRKFAIVLSNASGPVDVTEPIARYLLRSALSLQFGENGRWLREDLETEIKDQYTLAVPLWQRLEAEDEEIAAWKDDMQQFAGVYRHRVHGLEMEIKGNEVVFKRPRPGGEDILTTMNIGALGNRLRLFPMCKGLFIDRLTDLRNLELNIENRLGKVVLVANAGKDLYVKQ